jgi:hypothetical protein
MIYCGLESSKSGLENDDIEWENLNGNPEPFSRNSEGDSMEEVLHALTDIQQQKSRQNGSNSINWDQVANTVIRLHMPDHVTSTRVMGCYMGQNFY